MLVGLRSLTNFSDTLRYSLNPFERMLCPFKKHGFNDFRKKCLNENGIIENKFFIKFNTPFQSGKRDVRRYNNCDEKQR